MKRLISSFVFAVVIATALSQIVGNGFNGILQQQRGLEVFDSIRNLSENLVGNLQKSIQGATGTVGNLTTGIQNETEKIRGRISNNINRLRERVSKAITDVTTRFSNSSSNVINCVTSHRNAANSLFNDTIAKTMNCVEQRLSEVTDQINGFSNMANNAILFGNNALGDMNRCTQGNGGTFISIGNCLTTVAVQIEMRAITFATQSALTIGRISLSMATLPASLDVCVGTRLIDVGITSAKIITDIGNCSADTVISTLTGTSTGNKQPLLNLPPSLIRFW